MIAKLKRIDWPLFAILLVLMGTSLIVIYSATHSSAKFGDSTSKMAMYYALGFIVFFVMALVDYRFWLKYSLYIYIGGLALLLLVMIVGQTLNNAQGWLNFGGVSLQPAELFKMVLIMFLSVMLANKNKLKLGFWRDIIPLLGITFVPFALVMVQNDLGNALSYLIITMALLWIGNMKYTQAALVTALAILLIVVGIHSYVAYHDNIEKYLVDINREHWMERIDPWLMPDEATAKAVYHTRNAKLAIASGGLSGEGYMKGSSVQADRVPLTYSDSIFVVVAEEFGFIGAAVLLLLYFTLIHRLVLVSLECRERAGPYLIIGIVAMLLYQIFENIGMFIGLMPLTGITLPFISFGGTSLLMNMACMGLVMSIRIHNQVDTDELPLAVADRYVGSKAT
ncbi:FtsW/RodA/SpoVE family cell cycle protein [Paenibacillus sp. WLX2291]|uniref:FtsW/RodA/SpoVE family cell cycle protein n=1 Tax=Paenibacillus sp. WLX2291 TaxID=3296934 RepID=UPI0039843ED3